MPTLSLHAVDVYPYREGGAEWLVLRRAPGRSDAGRWRMVGGKIWAGETAVETARRELSEETGWAAGRGLRDLWAIPSVNAFYEVATDRVVLAPAFAALVEGDPTLDGEHDDWAWLPADEAARRLDWPEQARLLRLASDLAGRERPRAWSCSGGGPWSRQGSPE